MGVGGLGSLLWRDEGDGRGHPERSDSIIHHHADAIAKKLKADYFLLGAEGSACPPQLSVMD